MESIPKSFVEELRDACDIVAVVGESVQLRKTGGNYVGLCPFHKEKTPSFSVSPQRRIYHCFGCGASGDVISFVRNRRNMDFRHAIEALAQRVGKEVPYQHSTQDEGTRRRIAKMHDLLSRAAAFFAHHLQEENTGKIARNYLAERGIDASAVKAFAIGLAPPGWTSLTDALAQDPEDQKVLHELGLIKTSKGRTYDALRNRIVLPIRNRNGQAVGFGARALAQDDQPKYLNSPESLAFQKRRELYGVFERLQSDATPPNARVVVTEGYLDVIGLAQHGFHGAVATLGTAVSEQQIAAIFRLGQQVTLCFDGDRAGQEAARKTLPSVLAAMRAGRQVSYVLLPEDEDPDSMIRRRGLAEFEKCIDRAQPLSEFFFDALCSQVDMSSIEGRAELFNIAAPMLAGAAQGAFREGMLKELASRCNMAHDYVRQSIENPAKQQVKAQKPARERGLTVYTLAEQALSALLRHPQIALQFGDPDDWLGHTIAHDTAPDIALLIDVMKRIQESPTVPLPTLIEAHRGAPYKDGTTAEEMLACLASDPEVEPNDSLEAFRECLSRLERQFRDRANEHSARQVASLDGSQKREQFNQIVREKRAEQMRARTMS